MNPLAITMPSLKKLNTYGVESPCERLPGVGSSLANPGLSKEQLVPSCVVITSIMADTFIGILAQHPRRCIVATFAMADVFMETLAQHLRRRSIATFEITDTFIEILAQHLLRC